MEIEDYAHLNKALLGYAGRNVRTNSRTMGEDGDAFKCPNRQSDCLLKGQTSWNIRKFLDCFWLFNIISYVH